MHVWRGDRAGVYEGVESVDYDLGTAEAQHGCAALAGVQGGGGERGGEGREGEECPDHGE